MGGYDGSRRKDVWRSTDHGATWTQVTANAGWSARNAPSSGVLPDGSIVLMGGNDGSSRKNDVWRSGDMGATWTQMTPGAGWSARYNHGDVVLPDGSIILMGGDSSAISMLNDVWQSPDQGATWIQLTTAGWSARYGQTSVVLPDGNIVLMGGYDDNSGGKNDVWRLPTATSSVQNPAHTYTLPGMYPVALQAYNSNEYNSTLKTGYIMVTGTMAPMAKFVSNSTEGVDQLGVQFTDISPGTSTSWNWDFGDGSTSTLRNPGHQYTRAGNYTVTLTVMNGAGTDTTTKTGYISVGGPDSPKAREAKMRALAIAENATAIMESVER
jgi:hypothetical protein